MIPDTFKWAAEFQCGDSLIRLVGIDMESIKALQDFLNGVPKGADALLKSYEMMGPQTVDVITKIISLCTVGS